MTEREREKLLGALAELRMWARARYPHWSCALWGKQLASHYAFAFYDSEGSN